MHRSRINIKRENSKFILKINSPLFSFKFLNIRIKIDETLRNKAQLNMFNGSISGTNQKSSVEANKIPKIIPSTYKAMAMPETKAKVYFHSMAFILPIH
jgi:hypothetical protein